ALVRLGTAAVSPGCDEHLVGRVALMGPRDQSPPQYPRQHHPDPGRHDARPAPAALFCPAPFYRPARRDNGIRSALSLGGGEPADAGAVRPARAHFVWQTGSGDRIAHRAFRRARALLRLVLAGSAPVCPGAVVECARGLCAAWLAGFETFEVC